MYTDPDGQCVWFVIIGVYAAVNVYQNWDAIKAAKGWEAVGRFAGFAAVGAANGVLSTVAPGWGTILGGGLQSGLNTAVKGGSLNTVLTDAAWGAGTTLVGMGVGYGMEKLTNMGLNGLGVKNDWVRNISTKVISSVSQSFTSTLVQSRFKDGLSWKQSFKQAGDWRSLTCAGLTGAADGVFTTLSNRNRINNTNNNPSNNQPDINSNPSDNGLNLNKTEPLQPLQPIQPNLQPALPPTPTMLALPAPSPFPSGHFEHLWDDVNGDYYRWVND